MARKRCLPTTGSVLSNTSTESTVSAASTVVDVDTGTLKGWMYWKRDAQCWTKVYVVLRKQFIWLMRSDAASSFASPLIHLAVAGVERTTLRSFLVTGPSNESMELHLYDEEEVWTWFDALVDATNWTRSSIHEKEKAKNVRKSSGSGQQTQDQDQAQAEGNQDQENQLALGHRRSSYAARLVSSFTARTSSSSSCVDPAYRGTLVVYHEERQQSRLRVMWKSQSQKFKASIRKRVEQIVDKYETSQPRPTLC